MRCEDINPLLVEYAEGSLPAATTKATERHLETCATCQHDFDAITDWRTMAANWHDEQPPAWRPPALDRPGPAARFLDGFRQWFPTFASATALVLVSVMYFQPTARNGTLPAQALTDYAALPELPQATQAAFDTALETNREQRKQELTSLLELLTAEMNRRSIETEESLRFLISSQIEGQKEMDQLYQLVEQLGDQQPGASSTDPRHSPLIERVAQ